MSLQQPEPEPPAMIASRRRRGAPANLLTLKSLLAGGGGLAAVILLLRALPAVSYRLHLPLWVFYALLIGGAVAAYVLRRRLGSPRVTRPGYTPSLDDVALRRLPLAMLAFKALPVLAVTFVVAWLVVFDHVTVALAWAALGFGVLWRLVWPSIWKMLFWR